MITSRGRTLRRWRMLGPAAAPAAIRHEGRGPAALVLHGFTGTPHEVAPLAAALAAEGRTTVAPPLPGHGTCPTLLGATAFDDWLAFARREAEALLALHPEGIVLAGFSLGSLVATVLAAELGASVCALLALAPPLALRPALRLPLEAFGRAPRVPDWYVKKLLPADVRVGRGSLPWRRSEPVRSYDRDPLRAAVEVARGGRRAQQALPNVTVPILVQHGAHDAVCPVGNAHRYARLAGSSDVTVAVYNESAHVLLADAEASRVVSDARAFVARHAPL